MRILKGCVSGGNSLSRSKALCPGPVPACPYQAPPQRLGEHGSPHRTGAMQDAGHELRLLGFLRSSFLTDLTKGRCSLHPPRGSRMTRRRPELVSLRACLVSNRVGLGGAKSASFTRGTAPCGLFLQGKFLRFRSVSTKESYQTVLRVRQRTPNRFNPHLYQTRSKVASRVRGRRPDLAPTVERASGRVCSYMS
jgi:hypothetical protein